MILVQPKIFLEYHIDTGLFERDLVGPPYSGGGPLGVDYTTPLTARLRET